MSISLRVEPTAEPKAPPSLDQRPAPANAVVWCPRLLPGGALDVGVLVETLDGIVVREALVADEPGRLAAYIAAHQARTGPGCPKRIGTLAPAEAGKRLVGRGYRGGWAVVVDDPGPDLAALASSWTAPRPSSPRPAPSGDGKRRRSGSPDFTLVLAGSCQPGSAPGDKFADAPRVALSRAGTATLGWWQSGLNAKTTRDGRPLLRPQRGPIIGLLAVAGALNGQPVRDLHAACQTFDIGLPEPTGDALDDLRAEALALARLHTAVQTEAQALGWPISLGAVASTGSLASILLASTGMPPLASRFDLPDRLRGAGAAAFHGGWFEAHVVHIPVPAVLADLSAAYARVSAALGISHYLTARRVEPVDVTAQLRQLLAAPDLAERALDRATWRRFGVTLVQVRPRGEVLPVKVNAALDIRPLDLGGDAGWWSWLDVVAAALRTGRAPEVVEAIHLRPVGTVAGLRPVRLPSGATLDLGAGDDLFAELVAQRTRIKEAPTLDGATRARRLRLAKTLPNSLFGQLARVDRVRAPGRTRDAGIRYDGVTVTARAGVVEVPGPWAWLPLAGAITAGTRLVMGATVAAVEQAGGTWLHAAADSLAIAATHAAGLEDVGPGIVALPLATIREILTRTDALLRPDGGASWSEEVGWDVPAHQVCSGTNRLGFVKSTGALVHVTETQFGGRRVDPTGEGQMADGHWTWAYKLHGAYLHHVATGGEPGTLPEDLPPWVDEAALVPAQATTPAVLRRLQVACPGRDIRPFATYVAAHGSGVPAISIDATPACWRQAEWRSPQGKPVRLVGVEEFAEASVFSDPTGLLVPETFRAVFRAWLGADPAGIRDSPVVEARIADALWVGKESDYLVTATDPLAGNREDARTLYVTDGRCAFADDGQEHGPARRASAYCSDRCKRRAQMRRWRARKAAL